MARNDRYIELVREIRVCNIHHSFAVDVKTAKLEFENVGTERIEYVDRGNERYYNAYVSCMQLEYNDRLITKLRQHEFNGKSWDAYAYSRCLVRAPSQHECQEEEMLASIEATEKVVM